MSTPAPDEAPEPEPAPPPVPAAKPEPPPEPTRWKRFKLPVNRKDRVVRTAPLPAEPARRGTSGRTVVLILLLVIGLPVAGCLFFAVLCAAGLR